MKRLLVLIPAAFFALPALAQTAPEGSYRDLWCGIAFGTAAAGAPYTPEDLTAARAAGDKATDEQKQIIEQGAMVDQFTVTGTTLVDKATAAYKGAGFSDEAFGTVKTELEPKVAEQISGAGAAAEFTFEECSALAPAAAGTPVDDAPPATPPAPTAPAPTPPPAAPTATPPATK